MKALVLAQDMAIALLLDRVLIFLLEDAVDESCHAHEFLNPLTRLSIAMHSQILGIIAVHRSVTVHEPFAQLNNLNVLVKLLEGVDLQIEFILQGVRDRITVTVGRTIRHLTLF